MNGPDVIAALFAGVAGLAVLIVGLTAGGLTGPARSYLRFAAGLGAALALADLLVALESGPRAMIFASAVTLLVAALAPAVLALAVLVQRRPWRAPLVPALVLGLACLAGLIAAATGSAFYAFAPLMAAVAVLGGFCGRDWQSARKTALLFGLGAAAFAAGAAAMMSGGTEGRMGFALFYAAGLLGIGLALLRGPAAAGASDIAVKHAQRRPARRAVFISRKG